MSQPYRLVATGGIKIIATGQIIFPGDPEWAAYQDWLAQQPSANTPGGPNPPGTGLLPPDDPPPTLAQMRAEALARLDALLMDKRVAGTVSAAGHNWTISAAFLLSVLIRRAVTPASGTNLPDANRVMVALTSAQLDALITAINARLGLVATNYVNLAAAINASATPLTINLNAGWP